MAHFLVIDPLSIHHMHLLPMQSCLSSGHFKSICFICLTSSYFVIYYHMYCTILNNTTQNITQNHFTSQYRTKHHPTRPHSTSRHPIINMNMSLWFLYFTWPYQTSSHTKALHITKLWIWFYDFFTKPNITITHFTSNYHTINMNMSYDFFTLLDHILPYSIKQNPTLHYNTWHYKNTQYLICKHEYKFMISLLHFT